MKNFIFISLLTLLTLSSQGQIQNNSALPKPIEGQFENPIYKLFPTENYWTFIKLDTRNGKMSQVHFTISEEGYEGELILNSDSLVLTSEEVNGRFTLYPTKNMYNFILLDQINGRTYQVQWNSEKEKRFVSRIY
ncbi:hypothetical protein HUK80_02010 [Flavobacterium sp. MAH-1]|uniref:DUF4488 domain-containing protein n=1 Tax=Flavobacterium agri TaxID=2743471 RepID=A0A7Y8Y1W8_9FLAO|nr:hypothetical protein [Flavobacterium agri]NUY79655.1 hypothetical protein [Flavobacterium agri]NYA69680.1 hypothetical protein [Flavobacterium agri]